MSKTFGSAFIIGAALLLGVVIIQNPPTIVAAQSFSDTDPVPGGMCGCMSCNCYLVSEEVAVVEKNTPSLFPANKNRSQVALLIEGAGVGDSIIRKPAGSDTKTPPASKPASTPKTTTTTAKPANTNTSSGSTQVKDSPSNKKETTTKKETQTSSSVNTNSSQSEDPFSSNSNDSSRKKETKDTSTKTKDTDTATKAKDTKETRNNATGKSNGKYWYESRSDVDFTAPTIDKASYDPNLTGATPRPTQTTKTSKPSNNFKGMGDNVKTKPASHDPLDDFLAKFPEYRDFYTTDPKTGRPMLNQAKVEPKSSSGNTTVKKEEPIQYYGPYTGRSGETYFLNEKGVRISDPRKK